MNLSPMRFKTFVWPHNPVTYSVTYERSMALHKIPFGRHHLQSLGQNRRIFKGWGEFVGEGAYDTFKKLEVLFQDDTPGPLVHPVWMTVTAWFVGLKLEQEPRSNYVKYSFEFWEVSPSAAAETVSPSADEVRSVTARGESLWSIAQRSAVPVDELLALNPSIRNPNLIPAGLEVRLK